MSPSPIKFEIEKKLPGRLTRAGRLLTPHGVIETPAIIAVATKATVKALTPEQIKSAGVSGVLANTYHLYLTPGDKIIKAAGGLHQFMNWPGPIMTDSGGFQVFSLGVAYGRGGVSKFTKVGQMAAEAGPELSDHHAKLAKIDDNGVTFRSHIDGREHRFTPELSIAIQHNLGADIIFAFDECTSPIADYDYQKKALARTHAWADRSLRYHLGVNLPSGEASSKQGLFGIIQGGRYKDLRQKSARTISAMDFAGFGIGGSFDKTDLNTAVAWVNEILPPEKPRHLLGIGEPEDLFAGIESGVDTFDCVISTRLARHGTIQTKIGRFNLNRAESRNDFSPLEKTCGCYTCAHYSKAYLAHLFQAGEMLAATLSSIHNLYFSVNLVKNIRQSILAGNFSEFKINFLRGYNKKNA